MLNSIYDLNDEAFIEYHGKVILIVNTASKCGYTPQFKELELLYKRYKEQGLVILGYPCNQFAYQEPGDQKAATEFCSLNYGVTFPILEKIDVNGPHENIVFTFLKENLKGMFGRKIKWNFTKFIIDKKGIPVKRFAPMVKPREIEKYITKLLSK
ncbi:MAG: glutathione peroxidase [Spirochaetaceae bacterium]